MMALVLKGQGPPWILCFFLLPTFMLLYFVSFGWKMAYRWMKVVYHWLWLFQNCLIDYCHPDIHGLPGLLRKWLVRTVVIAYFDRRSFGLKYKRTLCFSYCLVKHTWGKMRAPGALYSFRHYRDMICVYRRRLCLHKTENCMLMFVLLLECFWLFGLFLFFWLRIFGGLPKMLSVFLLWSWADWKILLEIHS